MANSDPTTEAVRDTHDVMAEKITNAVDALNAAIREGNEIGIRTDIDVIEQVGGRNYIFATVYKLLTATKQVRTNV